MILGDARHVIAAVAEKNVAMMSIAESGTAVDAQPRLGRAEQTLDVIFGGGGSAAAVLATR
jgi:hypothetical protein